MYSIALAQIAASANSAATFTEAPMVHCSDMLLGDANDEDK